MQSPGHRVLQRQQKTPDLVDQRRPTMNQPITDSVERLQIEPVVGLDGPETHVLPRYGLGDRVASRKSSFLT